MVEGAVVNSANAIPEALYVEIQQQTHGQVRVLDVGQDLGEMNRQETLHGLQLEEDHFVHDQVGPIGTFDRSAVEDHRYRDLAVNAKPFPIQTMLQASLVAAFQQPSAQACVDIECTRQDSLGNVGTMSLHF